MEQAYGKSIYFKARLRENGERLDTRYITDEELRENIHMDITIEDWGRQPGAPGDNKKYQKTGKNRNKQKKRKRICRRKESWRNVVFRRYAR